MSDMKVEILKKVNKTEISLRRLIENRTVNILNKIQHIKRGNKSSPNTGDDVRESFKDIKENLDVLVETIANLSAVVLRMNTSTDLTISRLRRNLNGTKEYLIRVRNEVTQLNYSLRTDMLPFVVGAVNDLRQELNFLRNSTMANVSELWRHWNRTDAEIEAIITLLAQQNESLHFKIAYHSDVLYAEVKDVEKKQLKFHNDTKINLKELRSDLNQTRHNLQENLDNQIARVNKTWRKALDDIDAYLRLSMKNINVDGIKKELEKNRNDFISKQQELKDDFVKTKASFQEKDRKHDKAISGQVTKMESMEKRIAKVEENLNSKTSKMEKDVGNLQKSVDEIKNKATRVLRSHVPLVLVLLQILNQFF
jgi:chromosome segregation ATPase